MNTTTDEVFDEVPGDSFVLPPHGYKTMCIFNLFMSSLSCVLCVVLILAMTVPLLNAQRRKRYSTYNLYLAFMAIPDLYAHGLVVYLLLMHQQWNNDDGVLLASSATTSPSTDVVWLFDYKWDSNVFAMSVASNLYVNAFLTLEIYKLLKDSNGRKRHRPPTITKVTKQAAIAYGLGISIFLVEYFISDFLDDKPVWSAVYKLLAMIYCAVIPLSIMVWTTYRIFRQELLLSTKNMYEGRLKILVVYFARIILSDLLLWLPANVLYFLSRSADTAGPTQIFEYHTCLLVTGLECIALFVCSITKRDARRLVAELLCCGASSSCCWERGSDNDGVWRLSVSITNHSTTSRMSMDPYLVTRSSFSPGDGTSDEDDGDEASVAEKDPERADGVDQSNGKDGIINNTNDDNDNNESTDHDQSAA